jgi:hypothetical protein
MYVADHPSLLEMASWIAVILSTVVVLAAGILYSVGQLFPLKLKAEIDVGQHEDGRTVIQVTGRVVSRTRDTQSVQGIYFASPPTWPVRVLCPWWYLKWEPSVKPFSWSNLDEHPDGLEVPGHGAKPIRAYLFADEIPYGRGARLLLESTRRRPVLTKIREASK